MKKEEEITELFFKDLEKHSIMFAEWMAKYGYEKVFKGKKGWTTLSEEDNYRFETAKKYFIKDLYKQFMIDYLCL